MSKLNLLLRSASKTEPVPASFFGAHFGALTPTTIWADYDPVGSAGYRQTPWPDIGIGTLRLWDGNGCTWRNIVGKGDWSRFDFYLDQAAQHGAEIIMVLGCGPDAATTAPGQQAGLYVGYNPNPPKDDATWTAWCSYAAQRLVSKGFTGVGYEVWNEVSDNSAGPGAVGSGFTGTVEQLVHLTQLASAAIKAIDPEAVILSPSFVEEKGTVNLAGDGRVTLDRFIAAGGLAFCDAVAIHGYNGMPPYPRPEGLIAYTRSIRVLLATTGHGEMPIWNTEWGFGTWLDHDGAFRSGGGGTPMPDLMPDDLGAAYVSRMLMLSWLVGYRRHCHYSLDGFNFVSIAMIDPANPATVKPAGQAFRWLSGLLTGGHLGGLRKEASAGVGYWSAAFTTAAGRRGRTYWCDDYQTVTLPIAGAVEVRDALGGSTALGASLVVTHSPQFVFFDSSQGS